MWSKRQLIVEAFAEIGIGAQYDIQPEEFSTALRRMDAMVAGWESDGIRIGYALPSTADGSELDDASGIADRWARAVFLNLAVELAPGFGKTLKPSTLIAAGQALGQLELAAAWIPPSSVRGGLPLGAWHKRRHHLSAAYTSDETPERVSVSESGDVFIPPN